MRNALVITSVAAVGLAVVAFACGEDTAPISDPSSSSGGSSGRTSTSSGTTSSGASSGTTSSGGSSGTSSSGGSSGTSSGDAGKDAASDGAADAGPPADHLLISELGVAPAGGEFIEIYNPTSATIDLSQYYVSDNAAYHGIAAGAAWAPVGTPNTDFLAQFPSGTTIAAGAVLVIATDPLYETQFGKCPNFILRATDLTCATGTAKAMVAPTNGGIGTMNGVLLSNDREMVVLFKWDGVAATVKDVDYVTWGSAFDGATRIDKSGVAGYAPDTDAATQKYAAAPGDTKSIERCSKAEPGEKGDGGNGITGHDETSESMNTNFKLQTTPTPGVKNTCL